MLVLRMKICLLRILMIWIALLCPTNAAQASSQVDMWSIDSGPMDPNQYFGEIIANGVIGISTTAVPFRTQQTEIYGAFEKLWPGSVSSVARSFNFLSLVMSIDGERIERPDQVLRFHQTLSLKDATVTTSFDYQDKVTVSYTLRALRHLPFDALMEVTVVAKRPVNLTIESLMDVPTSEGAVAVEPHPPFNWLNGIAPFWKDVYIGGASKPALRIVGATAKGSSEQLSIAAAQAFLFAEGPESQPRVRRQNGRLTFTRSILAGGQFGFALLGATITSAHVADPENEVQRLTAAAAIAGVKSLVDLHGAAWADLWKSDLVIQGDDEVARDVHSMLYHLYSFIREGSGYSISPMGLAGGNSDYLGHIFWDAEIWMFPTILALQPDLARSMLDYRFERLSAARKNAARNGYRGAQFPWESAATGEEDTWSEDTTGILEVHVTADVALAAWNYYRVTQDREWLRERGYPVIKECADYWTSRVTRNSSGHYEIRHVVAADEYANNVDNDAFTNGAAKENLIAATAAARILGLPPSPEWERIQSNLSFLTFPNGVTREYTNYQGEKTWQADVELLAYPLLEVTDPTAIRRNLDYYSSRFDNEQGPAMTRSIYAILYQRLGMPEKAYQWFKLGYERNKRLPFGVLSESATSNNPYFATAAGGLLQAILYGFGGLTITDHGLVQGASKLPPQWKSLTLTGIGPERRTYRIE